MHPLNGTGSEPERHKVGTPPQQRWLKTTDQMKMLLLLLSGFSRVRLCATPQTAALQAPLSLGFSRQEHWSG